MKRVIGLGLSALVLTGCFEIEETSQNSAKAEITCRENLAGSFTPTNYAVAIAATSPDYTTSDVLILQPNADDGFDLLQSALDTTNPSDVVVSAHRDVVYRLNRSQNDSITAYSISGNGTPTLAWEYSISGDDSSANPYRLAADQYGCGFVTRYDADALWVVNLDASSQDTFKGAEIDLSAFAYNDSSRPRMSDMAVKGDNLFVVLEHLFVEGWTYEARESSRLLVIDLDDFLSITEVDLEVRNATSLTLVGNQLYVLGRGNTSNTGTVGKCEGGIVSIDTANNNAVDALMTDCNDEDEYRFGRLTGMTVVDANNGYFIGSASWGDDTLYHFNPSAVDVAASVTAVAETGGRGLGGLLHVANTQAGNSSDLVFVSRSASGDNSAEIMVIDVSADVDAVAQRIATTFNPGGMALVQLP